MKTLFKALLLGLLIGTEALAGNPALFPQTGSPMYGKNFINVPNSQATDLGANKALIETGNDNLLKNPNFQATGITSTNVPGWTLGTGVTAAAETTIKIGNDPQSLKLTLSSASGNLLYQDVTPTGTLNTLRLEAGDFINTSVSGLQICPRLSGATITSGTSCTNIQPNSVWQYWPANMVGGAGSAGVSLYSASAVSGTVYVSHAYTGLARNFAQVSQSRVIGTVFYPPTTGCNWSGTNTSGANFAAQASCPTPTVTGVFNTTLGKVPGGNATNLPPGIYTLEVTARMTASTSGSITNTNYYLNSSVADSNGVSNMGFCSFATNGSGNPSGAECHYLYGAYTYTQTQTSVNFQVQGYTTNASNSTFVDARNAGAPTNGFLMVLKYSPTQDSLAVTAGQQWQPTYTILTSGSGTYTPPTGVSRIEVEMAGGGGGGGGSGTTTGTAAGDGGATTFGVLTAGGGIHGSGSGGAANAGGTASCGGLTTCVATNGGAGFYGSTRDLSTFQNGGSGGINPLGGQSTPGNAPIANTGAGGAGASSSSTSIYLGAGGAAGGYVKATIPFPGAMAYSVGAAGSAGGAGTSGSAGLAGSAGVIKITEYYYAANAPQFPGQLTCSGPGQCTLAYATWGTCTTSSCTIASQSGSAISSVARNSTGSYTVNFTASTFSSAPTCFYSCSGERCFSAGLPSTSSYSMNSRDSGGAALDSSVNMIQCVGPR